MDQIRLTLFSKLSLSSPPQSIPFHPNQLSPSQTLINNARIPQSYLDEMRISVTIQGASERSLSNPTGKLIVQKNPRLEARRLKFKFSDDTSEPCHANEIKTFQIHTHCSQRQKPKLPDDSECSQPTRKAVLQAFGQLRLDDIDPLVNSLNKCLLRAYYVPHTILALEIQQ